MIISRHLNNLVSRLFRTAYSGVLLNKNNHTQFIQLSFSFIYSCLANKTDRIWRILKFIIATEAAVEGKRMYF